MGDFSGAFGLVFRLWEGSKQVFFVTFEDIKVLSRLLGFFLRDLLGSGTSDFSLSLNFIPVFFEKSIVFRLFA